MTLLRPQDAFPKESWQEYADELEKQLATLKAALIESDALSLHWYRMAREGETREWEEMPEEEREAKTWYAEYLLAVKHPEIFTKKAQP
jgi:hypothetical protein